VRKILEITKVKGILRNLRLDVGSGGSAGEHGDGLTALGGWGSRLDWPWIESKVSACHLNSVVLRRAPDAYESSLRIFQAILESCFAAALLLAATNQIFSLLDPLIFRHVIDSYATKYHQYTQAQFVRGAGLLVLAAVGVGVCVAGGEKNFQDYFVNVIVQRLGARMYSDGIRHSLDLPYQVFEDQRSGETLGKLQKVRSDVERFITAAVNVLFISLDRHHFCDDLRLSRPLVDRSGVSADGAATGDYQFGC